MPRTKETRSFLGSIFERKAVVRGKKTTVYDVRIRVPRLNKDGEPERDEKGRIRYRDHSKRCYTKSEAQIELLNLPVEIKRRQEVELELRRKTRTLGDLDKYFRREYVKPAVFAGGRQITGYRQNLGTVKRYLTEIVSFFGEDTAVDTLTYEHCRAYRDHLASTPTKYKKLPAVSTFNKKLSILSRLLTVAVQLQWITVNPFQLGPPLIRSSHESKRARMLTYEEEAAILAQCDPYPHVRFAVICTLDTSMRRGEIWSMRWWQVDFDNKVIYLTDKAAQESKTGVSGILPLTERLEAELLKIRDASEHTRPKDLVLGRIEFKNSWKTILKRAKVTDLQFRDLRATGSTRMMLAGNAGDLVRKVTRHQRLETFLEHYTLVDVQNAQAIGAKLQKFNEKQAAKVTAKGKVKDKGLRRAA